MKEQTGNGEMENLKIEIGEAANRAMMQICGGGRLDCDLNELTMKSVCFTNKSWSSIDGKPHDGGRNNKLECTRKFRHLHWQYFQ